MGRLEVGGNRFNLWVGNYLVKIGEYFIAKGKTIIITNPSCNFYNPFTLIISFTVDSNSKCQMIMEGDYKVKYKEHGTEDNPITEQEMFMIIKENKKRWFYKG